MILLYRTNKAEKDHDRTKYGTADRFSGQGCLRI